MSHKLFLSNVRMSPTCTNEGGHTHKRVMCTHQWGRYRVGPHSARDSYMCHTYERVTNESCRACESCRTYELVWRTRTMYATHINESCAHTSESGIALVSVAHRIRALRQVFATHVFGRLLVCWMSHGTHINESCHTCECVMAHMRMSRGTYMNESWHTCEWVMAQSPKGHGTYVNQS